MLGLCARRIAADFERRYGLRPWLMESFVDPSAYEGTCYQAANWIKVGQTKGRGRNGAHDAGKTRKDVYLYPLVNDIHAQLGVERFPWTALAAHHGLEGDSWAGQEFGACALGDERLTRRLVKIAAAEAAQPGTLSVRRCPVKGLSGDGQLCRARHNCPSLHTLRPCPRRSVFKRRKKRPIKQSCQQSPVRR